MDWEIEENSAKTKISRHSISQILGITAFKHLLIEGL